MVNIIRKAYTVHRPRKVIHVKATPLRKSFTYMRKAGTTKVRAAKIIKRGASDRKTRIPPPKKSIQGYHPTMSATARHRAILKTVRMGKETPLSLGRHLLLLSTLTRATIPKASKVYKMNSKWIFSKHS